MGEGCRVSTFELKYSVMERETLMLPSISAAFCILYQRSKFKQQYFIKKIGYYDISAVRAIHNHYVTDRKPLSERGRKAKEDEWWLFGNLPCPIKQWQVIV